MRIQQRTGLHDWIEGIALTLLLCGAMAFVDYFAIHAG